MRLLIAEDDQRLLKSLKHIFDGENYTVDAVDNGTEAYDFAVSGKYDGIILDIMMPGLSGMEVLHKIRARGLSVPVLLLTAKNEISQRVEGLDAGADDYLPKPFATSELLARVRAMLRRKESYTPELTDIWGTVLNRSTYQLSYRDRNCLLSSKEFRIMEMLADCPGCIVTIDNLISHIWGWSSDVDVSVIWVHVSNIRKKLVTLKAPLEIHFVRGAGYKLENVK